MTAVPAKSIEHGGDTAYAPEIVERQGKTVDSQENGADQDRTIDDVREEKKGWFAYLKTRDFYILLALGYVLISFRHLLQIDVESLLTV